MLAIGRVTTITSPLGNPKSKVSTGVSRTPAPSVEAAFSGDYSYFQSSMLRVSCFFLGSLENVLPLRHSNGLGLS
jgi:hypothetical protein